MASLARKALALALLVFPVVTLAYRPFHIPKNLFTSGMKDASLPEGVRQISIQSSEPNDEPMSDELWSDKPSHRSRRAVPSSPPLYVEVSKSGFRQILKCFSVEYLSKTI